VVCSLCADAKITNSMYGHTRSCTLLQTLTHMQTYARVHIHTQITHAHTHTHTKSLTYTHMSTHTRTRTYSHTHTKYTHKTHTHLRDNKPLTATAARSHAFSGSVRTTFMWRLDRLAAKNPAWGSASGRTHTQEAQCNSSVHKL
jgi:hypothetical protein